MSEIVVMMQTFHQKQNLFPKNLKISRNGVLDGKIKDFQMPRSKELSADIRDMIVRLHQAGEGYKAISKRFEVPVSPVNLS
jgi:hypothetical protein